MKRLIRCRPLIGIGLRFFFIHDKDACRTWEEKTRAIFTVEDRKAFPVWGWSRPLTLIRLRAPNALEQVINCIDNMSDDENKFEINKKSYPKH